MQQGPLTICMLALATSIMACGSKTVTTPTLLPSTSSASPTPSYRQGTKLVLLTLDGARPDWIANYVQAGRVPNLAGLIRRGVYADYLQTVDPTLAVSVYLSLSTGAFPSQTGVVSERYHVPKRSLAEPEVNAASTTIVEPIWRTAMRHGLTTAVLFWPGISLDIPDVSADVMVAMNSSDVPSAQHVIPLQEAQGWNSLLPSFSSLREGSLSMAGQGGGTATTFYVLAVDSSDDQTTNYDLLILDADKNLSNGYTKVPLGKWTPVVVSPRLMSGAYVCFTGLTDQSLVLYTSAVNYTRAHPNTLLSDLNARFGFAPPSADVSALRAGWISPQQYLELMTLRAQWMMDVTLYVQQVFHPDLLLTTQTAIADCARAFLLVDARQNGYLPDLSELYAVLMQQTHQITDENLGRLLAQTDLMDSALLVVSGQGLASMHTSVHVNVILKNAGLLQFKTVDGQETVDESKTKAIAFASGGCAHIYINLQGREQSGLVSPDDYAKVQMQIVQALQSAKDADGQAIFARILKHDELQAIHLESSNSGDVFVQATPGYGLLDDVGAKKTLTTSVENAAAGFDSTLPEMHGIFITAGDGLASDKVIPRVFVIDIAPTIARMLQLQLSSTVDGHALEDIWR